MANNELDRLRALANFAEQVCSRADDGDEARRCINQLISRAEDDIRTKSLEIQMQQSHIALLKELDGFMTRPTEAPTAGRIRLNEIGNAGPRAIAGDAN
jgi:hypothetical protein